MISAIDLTTDVSDLLADPPPLPGWPEAKWRRSLGQGRIDAEALAALGDRRLHRLLRWATSSRSRPDAQMGTAAAVLAVVDRAVHHGGRDPVGVLADLHEATRVAQPVSVRCRPQRRMSPSPAMDRRPVPESPPSAPADSPLIDAATTLLGGDGIDLRSEPVLVGRLAAALDVAVEHWTAGAAPGAGLPAFPPEGVLRSTKRLAVTLGGDRDLLPLVYGPQPGRGRPLQVARRRGLAYWVALTLRAEVLGDVSPQPSGTVLRHWRTELDRLRIAADAANVVMDSLDAPTAYGREGISNVDA